LNLEFLIGIFRGISWEYNWDILGSEYCIVPEKKKKLLVSWKNILFIFRVPSGHRTCFAAKSPISVVFPARDTGGHKKSIKNPTAWGPPVM